MVSIILPTYNGASRIHNAIESVLAQTYTNWELIIVDDGSTDDVHTVLPSDARIRYIKNATNLGIQKALNRGLAEAKGVYIARIDDDDIWSDSTKLIQQVAFLEQHTEYILIGTGVVTIDETGRQLSRYVLPTDDPTIRSNLLRKNCFAHASVLFRNSGVRYSEDEHVRHAEDYELWLRLGMKGKFANLPIYGVTLTVRNGSLTNRNRVLQARRILRLAWQYKSNYPGAVWGICVATTRYLFFLSQKIIPFPKRLFWFIQAQQRGM